MNNKEKSKQGQVSQKSFESRGQWLFEICIGQRFSKDYKHMVGRTQEKTDLFSQDLDV